MKLEALETPALILDAARMDANIRRMRARMDALGVRLRPHVKTAKSIEAVRGMMHSPSGPITVSTLKEAEQFAARGVTDILYAVGIAPGKLDHVADLRRRGVDLAVVLDNVEAAHALVDRGRALGQRFPVLIEIDSDGHRAGVKPEDEALLQIAAILRDGADLCGVMTHAGGSYDCRTVTAIEAMAEQERARTVRAAERLRIAGHATSVVSVGSTPTAMFARRLDGVSEVRAGVFVFFDLVMAGLGVCSVDDIALSVLATVIGHQGEKRWIVTDAGWMAMSRDRGTAKQTIDQGYGLVCDIDGRPHPDLIVAEVNQEHGIISPRPGRQVDLAAFPVGTLLRILPNHACATAAQHPNYRVVRGTREIESTWDRFSGW